MRLGLAKTVPKVGGVAAVDFGPAVAVAVEPAGAEIAVGIVAAAKAAVVDVAVNAAVVVVAAAAAGKYGLCFREDLTEVSQSVSGAGLHGSPFRFLIEYFSLPSNFDSMRNCAHVPRGLPTRRFLPASIIRGFRSAL